MNTVHINNLDLNLLTALNALLKEKSVSKAADKIGRTQSALSHALGRLRYHFNDPLLVRDGWGMRLTPFAQTLVVPVDRAVLAMTDVFGKRDRFDPTTDRRRIVIATPDICAPLLADFVSELTSAAPNISVDFVPTDDAREAVSQSQADIGLGFTSGKQDVSLHVQNLPPLEWAVFAPLGHRFAHSGLAQDWADARHIGVGPGGLHNGPVDRAAKRAGVNRNIAARAQNFTAGLVMAAQENALFTTLKAPFLPLAEQLGMVVAEPPFDIPKAQATLTTPADFGNPFRIWVKQRLAQTLDVH